MSDDPRIEQLELVAWVGEDELGSGQIGIKQGQVPAGMIPLAAVGRDDHKLEAIAEQLQNQANAYGKTIRLCRFRFVSEEIVLRPKD
jgi:hypothetical protein